MREGVAMHEYSHIGSLAEELPAFLDPDGGIALGPGQPSSFQEEIPSTSRSIFDIAHISADEELNSYITSDDDTEMSFDGGVQITMTSDHAEELNTEMDMVDAEVMGPYNLAAIATNSAFNSAFDSSDDELEGHELEPPEEASVTHSHLPAWAGGDNVDHFAHQGAHPLSLPDAMTEVSQQLQHLQNGQEQGELAPSLIQHGGPQDNMEDQQNLSLGDFLYNWGVAATRGTSKKRRRGPHLVHLSEMRDSRPAEIRDVDLHGSECDLQGINWEALEVTRKDARKMRKETYKNYTNMNVPNLHDSTLLRAMIVDYENFFKFRRMDFKHKINLAHFQLRNLLACTSRNNLFYAGESRVYQTNPTFGAKATRMNLLNPVVLPVHAAPWTGIQISTIAANHNILIAGGFCGEYGMAILDQPGMRHTEGLITDDHNSITNHIEIQLNRHSGLPEAAIASNDTGLRILDCTTNQFVSEHKYERAVNCSAVSPDHRLRALVGDTRDVMICNAESGEILQKLNGHKDYGFACAWADNGWHVATGNQDKLIKIWDARMWTDQYGSGKPLRTIAANTAGARSLKFSPLGSGKRVLVAAEPADIISVIDAESYATKQTLDFYGEIAGVDFTPDGQTLFVGIHDSLRGGIMRFDKCGFGSLYGQEEVFYEDHEEICDSEEEYSNKALGLDWKMTENEILADPRSKRTATHRRRKAARLGDMDPF